MARPQKDPSEVVTTVGASVLPSVEAELQAIADKRERSKSWVAGKLLLRGLAGFRADGKLTEEDSPQPARRTTARKRRSPSRAAISQALATGLGFNGEPLSDKDKETIRKILEKGVEEGQRPSKAKPRPRAKKK